MKRAMSFRLSDETLNIIEKKASTHNINKTKILECMVHEFSLSTLEDKRKQLENRNKALRTFLKTKSKSIKKAWIDGFLRGWEQFQIRKSSSLFRISESPITKDWLKQKDLE